MTEADALGVSKAAVSAWLSQLTSWLCLKKANHAGLDTPKARSKTVHRCGESAQADARATGTPPPGDGAKSSREARAAKLAAKKEEEAAKKAEAWICCELCI